MKINKFEKTLVACKQSMNRKSPESLNDQLQRLAKKAIGKTLAANGWKMRDFNTETEGVLNDWTYTGTLHFRKSTPRLFEESKGVDQFDDIYRKFFSAAKVLKWFTKDGTVPAEPISPEKEEELVDEPAKPVEINLPADYKKFFSHIYGRDPHIRSVYQAIVTAKETDFHKRNHVLLYGPPSCGKTEILSAFEKMMGEGAVLRLDATATSKAGAENNLLKREIIPWIIILEELEKTNPINLPWMLGLMDQRAEIIKVSGRQGTRQHREVRCLCLATVNDMAALRTMHAGALQSRFAHKVYCPRPTEEILKKILLREVRELKGDEAWIIPALRYCIDVERTHDPRRAKAVLDAKDRLLTGEYQKDQMAIRKAEEEDQKAIRDEMAAYKKEMEG